MKRREPRCSEAGCRFWAAPGQDVCLRHGGVVPVRPVGTAPMDHMPLCGATTRTGGTCKQPRVRGATRCRMHGALAPKAQRRAAERLAETAIAKVAEHYGVPRDVSPVEALTEELHRTQGHVDFLAREVAARPHDPNLLVVYTQERAHLAKLADAMVRSNVAERRAVIAEQTVDALEAAVLGTLRELGIDPSGVHVRRVLARHLSAAVTGTKPNDPRLPIDAKVVAEDVLPEPAAF